VVEKDRKKGVEKRQVREVKRQTGSANNTGKGPSSAGMSPCISLKIKKRHYEHHMIETHRYLITWISNANFFKIGYHCL